MPTDLILTFNISSAQTLRCSVRTEVAVARTVLSFWLSNPLDMTSKILLHSQKVTKHIPCSSFQVLRGRIFQGSPCLFFCHLIVGFFWFLAAGRRTVKLSFRIISFRPISLGTKHRADECVSFCVSSFCYVLSKYPSQDTCVHRGDRGLNQTLVGSLLVWAKGRSKPLGWERVTGETLVRPRSSQRESPCAAHSSITARGW